MFEKKRAALCYRVLIGIFKTRNLKAIILAEDFQEICDINLKCTVDSMVVRPQIN